MGENTKNKNFLAISQKYNFSQKSDDFNRLIVKFPFWKCTLLYTLPVFKLWQKQIFTKSYQIERVATSVIPL